jgi:hypothetical protein
MTRTLSALALLLALTGPAAAQEVRLNVVGKDEATVRQDIRQAVEAVCRQADRDGAFQGAYRLQDCLANEETKALQQYREYQRDAHASVNALARNDTSASR